MKIVSGFWLVVVVTGYLNAQDPRKTEPAVQDQPKPVVQVPLTQGGPGNQEQFSKQKNEELNQYLASPPVVRKLQEVQQKLRQPETDPEVQRQRQAFEQGVKELLNDPEMRRKMQATQQQFRELETSSGREKR